MPTALPDISQLKSYGHAVAGHAGVMQDEEGIVFVKPCTDKEINFYETVAAEAGDSNPSKERFRDLLAIMPEYMGNVSLVDPNDSSLQDVVTAMIDEAGTVQTDKSQIKATVAEQKSGAPARKEEWVPTGGGKIKTDRGIALRNVSRGFVKPNILDLKLGVRLYADDAPAAKQQKMDKLSAITTHKNHGFRIAGMKTFRGSDDVSKLDDEEFMVYDKDYGRTVVNDDNLIETIGKFVFNQKAGIDVEVGKTVFEGLAQEVGKVLEVLKQHDVTMYSASLLIALEGDGKALERAISHNNRLHDVLEKAEKDPVAAQRVDSGIVMDEQGEVDMAPMYSVQLIDFAHAKFLPEGTGPDENFMMGIREVKRIFEQLSK